MQRNGSFFSFVASVWTENVLFSIKSSYTFLSKQSAVKHVCWWETLQSSWGKYDLQLSKHSQTGQAIRATGLQFHAQTPHSTDVLTFYCVPSLMIQPYTPLDTLNKHRFPPPPPKKKGNFTLTDFNDSARSLFLLNSVAWANLCPVHSTTAHITEM